MTKYGEVLDYKTADKAVIGKKYVFGDSLRGIQEVPEHYEIQELTRVIRQSEYPFETSDNCWQFCREVIKEEVLMTNRQLAEWLARGNGQVKFLCGVLDTDWCQSYYSFDLTEEDNECSSNKRIRPWGSDEWVKPTIDIYKRDCKGGM